MDTTTPTPAAPADPSTPAAVAPAASEPVQDKRALLLGAKIKQITVDGLDFTLGIKKLKWGEYQAAEAYAAENGDEPGSEAYNLRLSMSVFVAGVVDPDLTMDDIEHVDLDLFAEVAHRVLEHSGLTDIAAKEVAKSGSQQRGEESAPAAVADGAGDGAVAAADPGLAG